MAKTGRNDPCPCGSGNKYKRCCLEKDEAAAAAARAAEQATRAPTSSMQAIGSVPYDDADELDAVSNGVIALVKSGKLDEAERAANDLLTRFPEVHDGWERLGMVFEARGDNKRAADCYRNVIAFIENHSDNYDPEFADTFRRLVARLDPPAPT